MNKSAYNKGQATRATINAGATKAADTAKAAGVAVLSFFKGLATSPVPEQPVKRAATKRPARRAARA